MKCIKCKHLGVIFDHLKGYDGIDEWRNCEYPLPYHVTPRAIPMGIEHNCQTYEIRREYHE